jgi:hypothetical protein
VFFAPGFFREQRPANSTDKSSPERTPTSGLPTN